jgi:alpha-galactosidase
LSVADTWPIFIRVKRLEMEVDRESFGFWIAHFHLIRICLTFVVHFRVLAEANAPLSFLRLKGLDPNKNYEIIGSGEVYGGDELMYVGLNVQERRGDFISVIWHLKESHE